MLSFSNFLWVPQGRWLRKQRQGLSGGQSPIFLACQASESQCSFTLPNVVCVHVGRFRSTFLKLESCRPHSSFVGHQERPILAGSTYRITACEICKEPQRLSWPTSQRRKRRPREVKCPVQAEATRAGLAAVFQVLSASRYAGSGLAETVQLEISGCQELGPEPKHAARCTALKNESCKMVGL